MGCDPGRLPPLLLVMVAVVAEIAAVLGTVAVAADLNGAAKGGRRPTVQRNGQGRVESGTREPRIAGRLGHHEWNVFVLCGHELLVIYIGGCV